MALTSLWDLARIVRLVATTAARPVKAARAADIVLHKLVDAPVAEVRRIDGSPAVHGYVMWSINLAGNLPDDPSTPKILPFKSTLMMRELLPSHM
jgi:hypothetical protein